MKGAEFSRLYGLVALLCILYLISDEILFSGPRIQTQPNQHRQLIRTEDTCSSKFCPNLFFLSGIYDIINFDMRFTNPFEQRDPSTLFGKASFSEYARSRVKKFSSFEFSLYSDFGDNSKNTISGSYDSTTLVNGSAMIVVSELPGQEMWFHSDSLLNADCLNDSTSLIVFANALNSQMNFFTKTPEGFCRKIEMEDESPFAYCQARSGFVWEIYVDWKCSSQIIASDYINGGLGTVYSVIIGNNISSADLVTLSSSSSFEGVKSFKQSDKSHPSFFQRNMIILVISAGSGAIGLLFVFYLAVRSSQPAVSGFREGDIVVYQLTRYQINMLQHRNIAYHNVLKKTKGFALIVRAPPAGFLAKISSSLPSWRSLDNPALSPKFVLQLQPLKKVLRTESQNLSDVSSPLNDSCSSSLELMIDDHEAPLSINKWGLRGGRVLHIVSPSMIHRRSLYVGDVSQQKRVAVRFADRPTSEEGDTKETEMLAWMDLGETDCLLTSQEKRNNTLRNRKKTGENVDVLSEESDEKDNHEKDTSLFRLCRRLMGSDYSKPVVDVGSGWIFPSSEDNFFLLDDASMVQKSVDPYLKKSSHRYERATGECIDPLPPGIGYSYLLTNLPSKIAGDKIENIYSREWVYPFTTNGRLLKRDKSSRRQLQREVSLGSPSPLSGSQITSSKADSPSKAKADGIISLPNLDKTITKASSTKEMNKEKPELPPVSPSPRKLVKASGQAENLLNVLIKEYESPSPNENSNIDSPDVSRFVASPQPISVRIALRREHSRKTRAPLPSIGASSPLPVFTAPRLITSPLPVVPSDSLKVEEISSPSSPIPMQSYFVTPPRSDSMKSRKPVRQLSANLYSQTNKKSKKPSAPLTSPNSTPQLNHGGSINSSATTIPTSQMNVNADREVSTEFGSLDKVMTGSKLEIDDEENENEEHTTPKTKSRGTKHGTISRNHSSESQTSNRQSQTPQKLRLSPVIVSPRHLSRPSSVSLSPSNPPHTFTASPKTLPVRNSPRRTLSARQSTGTQQIPTIEWEEETAEHPRLVGQLSSKFEMDLSFLPDPSDGS